ncbi:hypothetical protein JCM16303_001297 [Sporobolomyces ruberrimus]
MGSSSDLEFMADPVVNAKSPSPKKPRVSGRARRAPRSKDELAAPAAPLATTRARKVPPKKKTKSRAIISDDEEEELVDSINMDDQSNLAPSPSPPAPAPRDPTPPAPTTKEPSPVAVPSPPKKTITASSSAPSLAPKSTSTESRLSSFPAAAPGYAGFTDAHCNHYNQLQEAYTGGKATREDIRDLRQYASVLQRHASTTAPPAPPPRRASTESASTRPSSSKPRSSSSSQTTVPARKPYVKPPGGDSSDEADDFFSMSKKPTFGGRIPGKSAATTGGRIPGGGGRIPKASSRSSATPGPGPSSPPKPKQRKFAPSSSSDDDSDTSKSSLPQPTTYSSDGEQMTKDLALPAWARGSKGGRPGMSGADLAKQQRGATTNRKRRKMSHDKSEDEADGKGKGKMDDVSEGEETDDSLEISIGTPKAKVSQNRARPKRPGLNISLNDDDDEEEEGEGDKTMEGTPKAPTPKPKSPSPKKMSAAQMLLESARGLKAASPTKSPQRPQTGTITLDSSSDNDDPLNQLDPALAAIRSGFKKIEPDFEITAGPSKKASQTGMVTISLKMTFDPTLTVSEVVKRAYEKLETFEIGVNKPFSELFDLLAAKRYLNRNDLVITYNKSQLYDFGTPQSLRLSAGSTASMQGYTRAIWEKTKRIEQEAKEKKEAEQAIAATAEGKSDDDDLEEFSASRQSALGTGRGPSLQPPAASTLERSRSPSARAASGAPNSPDKNLFRITIRGSKTQSIDLAVKYTTTMQSLVKAYAKQHAITDPARIAKMFIEIEGDKVESTQTIQDIKDEFDLDDEETVDLRDPAA